MYIRPAFVPTPHTFCSSCERTAKSNIWPIRQWGVEVNLYPEHLYIPNTVIHIVDCAKCKKVVTQTY